MNATEVYEQYKHLDALLCDLSMNNDFDLRMHILYDLWQVVRERRGEREAAALRELFGILRQSLSDCEPITRMDGNGVAAAVDGFWRGLIQSVCDKADALRG
jgi:hypothetical protein